MISSNRILDSDSLSAGPGRGSLCVVVPYRDRSDHLAKFIPHVRQYLAESGIAFAMLVVEQSMHGLFNRGKLLNAGVHYTNCTFSYYCFHDVDMLPLEDVDYSPCSCPTHLAAKAEQFGWTMPYPDYFGGVTLFDRDSFLEINGFSNDYWGWGCEDDDCLARLRCKGVPVSRRCGSFHSLQHERSNSPLYEENCHRLRNLNWCFQDGRFTEGFTTLSYEIADVRIVDPMLHHVVVNL